ncbi:MAG: 16S rRNA (cytosine(1402)-N(4))-methyltransferase RsmH, partial [Calditrichia bacterium]
LHEVERYPVNGVLYDLGLSSHHLNHSYRGFAFQAEAPLDMRFNRAQKLTAADVVNEYSQEDLGRIIREYGEESRWRRIAAEIVRRRQETRFETTKDLADLVRNIVGERKVIKSLAKVFQAIRIEVNLELERLKNSLEQAFCYLKEGGRIVVISYHSLEDRITKEFFRYKALSCICPDELPVCVCNKVPEMRILTRKPIKPAEEEIRNNPRSRSARLRAAEKIIPFTDV